MNQFIKTIKPDELGHEFLQSLNGLLCLTDRELEVLAVLLRMHISNTKNRKSKDSIDSSAVRKLIMKETSITKDNLSRYMKLLRDKGIIIKDTINGTTVINKALVPIVIGGKSVQITMILKIKEDVAI